MVAASFVLSIFVVVAVLLACLIAMLVWPLATIRGPVVSISSQGLLDRRLSNDVVPLDAVRFVCFPSSEKSACIFTLDDVRSRHIRRAALAMPCFTRKPGSVEFHVSTVLLDTDSDSITAAYEVQYAAWRKRAQDAAISTMRAAAGGDADITIDRVTVALKDLPLIVVATSLDDRRSHQSFYKTHDADGHSWLSAFTHDMLFEQTYGQSRMERWPAHIEDVIEDARKSGCGLIINPGLLDSYRIPPLLFQRVKDQLDRV